MAGRRHLPVTLDDSVGKHGPSLLGEASFHPFARTW